MKLQERLKALAVHLDRLMHEGEPAVTRLVAPERSMARTKPPPQEEEVEIARPRPGAMRDDLPTTKGPSRSAGLKKRLREPGTVREAIILKEVLDRPLARRRR